MFRHFLNFKDKYPHRIEITEPVGFDAMTFTVKQDEGRFGRDVMFAAEDIPLKFEQGILGVKTEQTLYLPNGISVDRLTMGYEWLIEFDNKYGFEADVEYILQVDGVDFIVGELDFENRGRKYDNSRYLEFTVIQNAAKQKIKRLQETVVDIFKDKDLDGNDITPLTPKKMLLKAKPITNVSEWKTTGREKLIAAYSTTINGGDISQQGFAVNNASTSISYAIENSLSYLTPSARLYIAIDAPLVENFSYIYAKNELTNVKVDLTDIVAKSYGGYGSEGLLCTNGEGYVKFVIRVGSNISTIDQEYEIYRRDFGFVENSPEVDFPTSYSVTIPVIPQGKRLYIYALARTFNFEFAGSAAGFATYDVKIAFKSMNVKITATSTAVNSVIQGTRYIELFEQNIKSMNGFPVVSPRYQLGGSFWDNFATTGKGIRGFASNTFPVNFKDLSKGLSELCADYQILSDRVFITQYDGFYPNREIGVFESVPGDMFETMYNTRYTLINFNYRYNRYEQDRDEKNTVDAVHTETQYKLPNKKTEGKRDVEVPQRRDPFGIESDRRQGISTKDSTALSGDDDLSLIDLIEMSPGTVGSINQTLLMRINEDGKLQILNNDSNGNGIGFNWNLQGFKIGDVFTITFGQNIGSYIVYTIENTVLTLTPIGFTPAFDGDAYIKCEFYYTDVQFVNRTNEGFTLIENLSSGDNFSNLQYTIRRNLKYWEWFLATCVMYQQGHPISNTYFKSNGALKTQFLNGEIYIENENIINLPEPFITPLKYKLKVQASFTEVLDLLRELETIVDDTIGGFVRLLDADLKVVRGYISMLKYNWKSQELELEVEQKYEPEILSIEAVSSGILKINGVIYNISSYEVKVNRFEVFDKNKKKLYNGYTLDKVSINGTIYNNETDFCNALNNIL